MDPFCFKFTNFLSLSPTQQCLPYVVRCIISHFLTEADTDPRSIIPQLYSLQARILDYSKFFNRQIMWPQNRDSLRIMAVHPVLLTLTGGDADHLSLYGGPIIVQSSAASEPDLRGR